MTLQRFARSFRSEVSWPKASPSGGHDEAVEIFGQLNEQVSLEAALGLAHIMLTDKGTLEQRITRAFQRCTSRKPGAAEIAALVSLYKANISPDPKQAELFRETYKPVTLDLSAHPLGELFAAATVARTLLNLDETITKN